MEPTLINNTDTIAAISTPPGVGGLAVIRISGPDAFRIVDEIWKGCSFLNMKSHTSHLGFLLDSDNSVIDNAVATIFRGPNSFTGEDSIELSVHGGKWIQQATLNRLISVGIRPAERGEFTRRAFMNGRLDLAQAEGVADLIAADSKASLRLAISQTSGSFSKKIEELRSKMIDFAAMLELELDFSEEDVEFADRSALLSLCDNAHEVISGLANSFRAGKMFKEGVPVVIAGRPNAGKSTLLNTLADDDLAIVSDIPGTTRDIIESCFDINGVKFRFFDTAGLHDSDETIEQEGIIRAMKKINAAEILLWLVDPADPKSTAYPDFPIPDHTRLIVIYTKSDLNPTLDNNKTDIRNANPSASSPGLANPVASEKITMLRISAKEGRGIEELKAILSKTVEVEDQADIVVSNARHYAILLRAAEAISRASENLKQGISADFVAQDVREAIAHLAEITGQISSADLLQTIFSRFCIGK